MIGDNVSIFGGIDLRNREDGRIVLKDNSTIDGPARLVAARSGTIELGEESVITPYALINGGGDIIIGRKTIIGPRASINANDHVFERDIPIRDAGFIYAPIFIGNDCWLAANVVVMKGVTIADGSVVGAGAIVTKDTEPYSINVGVPARKVGERR
jgi:acetyltransferase-like isoleucine patch superfamily enzyme